MPIEQTVFIVTYGRSGSTLLQSILGSVPGVHICGENGNALYHLYESYSSILKAHRLHFPHSQPNKPWYGAHKLQPEEYGRHLAEIFIKDVLAPPPEASTVGFKEIRYFQPGVDTINFITYLAMAFPNPKFILNSRNHDDVAKSAFWLKKEKGEALKYLGKAETLMKSIQKAYPSRTCHVQYDDYVSDPSALAGAFELLNLPFDEAAVREIMSVRLNHGKALTWQLKAEKKRKLKAQQEARAAASP